ncbi:MAG TPA: SUMF1/EgtB/PvdO family nonheme iron enzyme [Candidatus Paceibacterota bacterium]|nr:SUMF1/EgtB/PvdO family nonheme iron enzyme [Candidatus Paceibacterota bacterium]
MFKWLKNGIRFLLVTLGVVLLTSFTIDATDTLSGSQTALSIFSSKVSQDSCPMDMVLINHGSERFCLDIYEASPHSSCLYQQPNNITDTTVNISDPKCLAISVPEVKPWTYVAKPQAEQLCAKSGKRLPTPTEWYLGSLGTPDNVTHCNLAGSLALTGSLSACRSGIGSYDMIGNVWELVDGQVSEGFYDERQVPEEGYVAQVDAAGIALLTSEVPNDIYNQDYFWSRNEGQFVLMRGGYYGSRKDGGIFSTHAQSNQDFASAAVGFRCAKSLM